VVGVIGVLVAIPACALATERVWYGAAVFRRAGSTHHWFLCHERSSLHAWIADSPEVHRRLRWSRWAALRIQSRVANGSFDRPVTDLIIRR
jgi:hypothetical protein